MSHPLLYTSDDGGIVVLDLPTSIRWAQGAQSHLCSVDAIREPFQTPEPKGEKLSKFRNSIPADERRNQQAIEALIRAALTHARQHLPSEGWHLVRAVSNHALTSTDLLLHHNQYHATTNKILPPLILSPGLNHVGHQGFVKQVVVHNPSHDAVGLSVDDLGCFHIPPKSTFLMATVAEGLDGFQAATRTLWPGVWTTGNPCIMFDLILLDPPWGNRSVRHSKAYITTEDQLADPFEQTIPILENFLASNGYVAIWITNKAKIREQVIAAFAPLQLKLVEEWVWIKITTSGEPIMPLGGLWRKPYEILLIFRNQEVTNPLRRKVIIAVPDVHSRKPNLKCLLDDILSAQYQALELFARSLTSGWWSWGDEVLKFQHESCWVNDF